MTGWTDIDGRLVMAGSPGIIECFDVTLGSALGQYSSGFVNLRKLRDICVEHGHQDLVARCDLAEQLITAARELFGRVSTRPDPYEACKAAVRELNP